MTLTIHHQTRDKVLAHTGPMIVAVIAGADPDPAATRNDVEQMSELINTLLATHPAVAVLVAVEHGAPKPTLSERQYMQAALDRHGDRLVIGYAFCGLGFWASAMQTIIVGVSRLAGASAIAHVSVAATAEHIARELVGLDADVMTALCEQLRIDLREGTHLSSKA